MASLRCAMHIYRNYKSHAFVDLLITMCSVLVISVAVEAAHNPTRTWLQHLPISNLTRRMGLADMTKWRFEGLLDPDGSISTDKLMIEHGPSGDGLLEENFDRLQNLTRAPVISTTAEAYPPCPEHLRDFTPCSNFSSGQRYGSDCNRMAQEVQHCAIPTPANYARQFKWPSSKNHVREPNVPNVPLLKDRKWQPWIQHHENVILLQTGEPNFQNGTSEHFDKLLMMVPGLTFGDKVRVALDIGCGAGNVAAALEMRGTITLSVPGENTCNEGVQLILERGYPSLLQIVDKNRLPYPSQAFDLLRCAACNVQWDNEGGLRLFEADRILRAGGFFVWVDPSETAASWNELDALTKKICWKLILKAARLSVWQKATNNSCYLLRPLPNPPICKDSTNSGTQWNMPLQSCIVGFSGTGGAVALPWPLRLEVAPLRLKQAPAAGLEQVKEEAYKTDLNFWKSIVDIYVAGFGKTRLDDIRNVLDMNAGYGGFATAVVLKKPALQWWVMNVVPVHMPDRLPIVFDRGHVGIYHDWCGSLNVHPRTFDLIHASSMFSSNLRVTVVMKEIDRLLRPGGFVLVRDNVHVLGQVEAMAAILHWKAMVIDTDSGPRGKNKVLSCQKTFWRPGST